MSSVTNRKIQATELAQAVAESGQEPSPNSPLLGLDFTGANGDTVDIEDLTQLLPTLMTPETVASLTHIGPKSTESMVFWGRPGHAVVGLWAAEPAEAEYVVIGPLDAEQFASGIGAGVHKDFADSQLGPLTLDRAQAVAFAAMVDTLFRAELWSLLARQEDVPDVVTKPEACSRIAESLKAIDGRWFVDKLARSAVWDVLSITEDDLGRGLSDLAGMGLTEAAGDGWRFTEIGAEFAHVFSNADSATILTVARIADDQNDHRYVSFDSGIGISFEASGCTIGGTTPSDAIAAVWAQMAGPHTPSSDATPIAAPQSKAQPGPTAEATVSDWWS